MCPLIPQKKLLFNVRIRFIMQLLGKMRCETVFFIFCFNMQPFLIIPIIHLLEILQYLHLPFQHSNLILMLVIWTEFIILLNLLVYLQLKMIMIQFETLPIMIICPAKLRLLLQFLAFSLFLYHKIQIIFQNNPILHNVSFSFFFSLLAFDNRNISSHPFSTNQKQARMNLACQHSQSLSPGVVFQFFLF